MTKTCVKYEGIIHKETRLTAMIDRLHSPATLGIAREANRDMKEEHPIEELMDKPRRQTVCGTQTRRVTRQI